MTENPEHSVLSPSDSPPHSSPEADLDRNALTVRPAAPKASASAVSTSTVNTPNQNELYLYVDLSPGSSAAIATYPEGEQPEHGFNAPNSLTMVADHIDSEAPDEDEQLEVSTRATPEFNAINVYSSDEDQDEQTELAGEEDEENQGEGEESADEEQPEFSGAVDKGKGKAVDEEEYAKEEHPGPSRTVDKGRGKAIDNRDASNDEGYFVRSETGEGQNLEPVSPGADNAGHGSPDQASENQDDLAIDPSAASSNDSAPVAERRPTRGIERQVAKPGNPRTFNIVRLIENTDKRGNNQDSAIRLRVSWFVVDFGDFLLDLSTARAEIAQVRNYWGQERFIPRRMLQNVYQPWDIPAKIRITHNGIPLPLGFLKETVTANEAGSTVDFEEGEAVMVMSDDFGNPHQVVRVTDFERHAGEFDVASIDRGVKTPWEIMVNKDDLTAAWAKKSAPKLPKEMKRKKKDEDEDEEDDDNGGEGSSKKPPRKKPVKKPREKKEIDDDNGGEGPSGTNAGKKYDAGYLSAAIDELMEKGKKAAAAKDLQVDNPTKEGRLR